MRDEAIHDARLAEALACLAHPARLALARQLREPAPIGGIELWVDEEGGARRPMARQSVREHLDRLLDAGVVLARPSARDARSPVEYVVNHQVIFALAEETLALARLRPAVEPDVVTSAGAPAGPKPIPRPALVVVKGLETGVAYDLAAPPGEPRAWTIGRRRSADVCLDFDAQVSADHGLVRWTGSSYLVEDLPTSRNGMTLGFAALPKGKPTPVRDGSLLGVGRCVLTFQL
jgi:DNA-binding transcriptional ArsR family regulator